MTEGTKSDWARIMKADTRFAQGLPDWLLGHLSLLRNDCHGFPVDRLEHCLQSATRAFRAGRDEEYVTCALLHDIGAALAPADHAAFAAMVLRPYVSEPNRWMLEQHSIFSGYYYLHFIGGDRHERERLRGHPHFEYTAEFCHQFDQSAFDPDYDSMPLEAFEPIVRRVLSKRKH